MKKEANKPKVNSADREFAVILERIYSEIKIIGEDLSTVKDRVKIIYEEQGRLREEIFIIKTDIRVIKTRLEKIETRLEKIEVDVDTIKTDFGKRLVTLETTLK